jgi:transcriptional regulator with XRE-family HTH domain
LDEQNLMRERELDPGASPAAFFGSEVREARTRAKMSQPALGASVCYDATYVSKVETGAIVPDDDFVNGLDRVFPQMNGWFARFKSNSRKWEGRYPAWFNDWVEAEGRARVIRWWEPLLIPGLLQTADYARELFLAWQTIEDAELVDRSVAARLDRQAIFGRPDPPTLLAVVDEPVLWRGIGSPQTMRCQLEHLINMSMRPNIAVHVVPSSVGAHTGLLGAFIEVDLEGEPGRVVYLETPDQGLISDARALATKILGMFERVRSEALPKRASQDLIRKVVNERWTA